MKSAYQIYWNCIQFHKNVPKYAVKNTHSTIVIGNVVMTYSQIDYQKIKKNVKGTTIENNKEFKITDKQFSLIQMTNLKWKDFDLSKIEVLKKCKIPHLIVNNDGNTTLIPVTNKQFLGTNALERKTVWI